MIVFIQGFADMPFRQGPLVILVGYQVPDRDQFKRDIRNTLSLALCQNTTALFHLQYLHHLIYLLPELTECIGKLLLHPV